MRLLKITRSSVIAAFTVVGIGSFPGANASGKELEPIRIQIGGEPSTLEPAKIIDQYGFGIARNVVEGLFRLDASGRLINGLAQSHTLSKDGLQYRFKIRGGAKWSDGKPVRAEDFVFAFQHALNPKTAAPNADSFFAIKNAQDVYSGKKPLDSLAVRSDKGELIIELSRPHPTLLLDLTLPVAAPLRKDVFEANKGQWSHRFPVTGDYTISVYRPAEHIELKPNPHAKSPGKHPVIYKVLTEEITAMNLFESGGLDVISTITASEIKPLQTRGLIQLVPSTTVFYISFNMTKPPFNDLTWRKAVAASVDREGLSKVLHGVFEPTTSYLPKMVAGSSAGSPPPKFENEAERIRKLPNKPRIKLAYGASAFTKIVSEKLQNDLSTKLGLKLALEPMELKTLLGRLKSDPPEMYFLGMSAVYDDPMNQLQAFSAATAPNFSRYSNPEFERLLEQIRTENSSVNKTELARKANQLLIEGDVAVVPIVLRMQVFGVSKKIKGFKVSPYQVIQLNQLTK